MSKSFAFALLVVAWASACESGGGATQSYVVPLDPQDATAYLLSFSSSGDADLSFQAPGGQLELLIDCSPDDTQVDVRGFEFSIAGAPFTTAEPRAGFLRQRAMVPAGAVHLHLAGDGGPAKCSVQLTQTASACGPRTIWRSINVDHDHVDPGPEPRADWETFPVSGNHYPIWAAWDTEYNLPIKHGYLLHDLEHGGIVYSYRCYASTQSTDCATAVGDLRGARAAFAQTRSLITPDPTQPDLYAARAWRWGYSASCYDAQEMNVFSNFRYRKGREDFDTDAAPFDPTM